MRNELIESIKDARNNSVDLRNRLQSKEALEASACEALAGDATPLSCALHSDLCLLAQSGGDLVQPHHATSYPPRNLPQRERTGDQDR